MFFDFKCNMVKFALSKKRILTSLVMIPIAIGALRSGHPYVDILIFAVGALLSWEWSNMVPNKNKYINIRMTRTKCTNCNRYHYK